MSLGSREISRYCLPPDEATGCDQCELVAQEQCKQTFYLKQQNEIMTAQQQVNTVVSSSTDEIARLKSENEFLQQYVTEQKNSINNVSLNNFTPMIYLSGGVLLGVFLTIVVLKVFRIK